ncbi:MAG: esterase [Fibrobacter sp.]|nr:esterase [Fibrobacter sp.]
MKKMGVLKLGLAVALSAVVSNAFIVTGTVSNENGEKIKGADVTLINNNISTKTDETGSFTLEYDPISIQATSNPGFVGVKNGVLSYAQSSSGPVQVQIFDALGFRVMDQKLFGSGSVDLRGFVKSEGTYFARIHMGSAQQNLKFTAKGSYEASVSNNASKILKKDAAGDDLRVIAEGYDTLVVTLTNLDTNVTLTLKKTEPVYSFGYALKNTPTPSKGCGMNSTLTATKNVENGQRFEMKVNGLTREFFITLPKNYDNTKPYKILFAMHCMGSNAEDFVHHAPDYDHPSPYYGQQNLDTEGNYIFISPRGDTDGMPWSVSSDKDHVFFDQLLTLLENNYCIDTSRVFVTGFSFGAMVTNSLAQDFQHRIRAVAVYATADYNIYLPTNKGKPISWMAVHGKNDGICNYDRAKNSALVRILKNNGKPDANGNFTDASAEKPEEVQGNTGHVCHDFKSVDPRFPVKFCSWPGGHQWTAHDYGSMAVGAGWQDTWVPQAVHAFFEQF